MKRIPEPSDNSRVNAAPDVDMESVANPEADLGVDPEANAEANAEADPRTGVYGRPAGLADPSEIQRIGDYEILEELGRGGMGIVFKARQVSLNRIIALKMILGAHFADETQRMRLFQEAELIASLRHPNIVAIHDIGDNEGLPYYTMDFIGGGTLKDRILVMTSPFSWREAAQHSKTMAEAMLVAHQQGVIHRDLKPQNIMLDLQGRLHITDFGLARDLNSVSELTMTGALLGTPNYISPEQTRGDHSPVTPATDIYSLGAILYEMLTMIPPFPGGGIADVLERVRTSEPIAPRRINPSIPWDLNTVCLKCLQKDPARRYGSAGEFAEDLERVLQDIPIKAKPVTTFEYGWRWCKRNGNLATTLAVSATILLGGTILAFYLVNSARLDAERAKADADAQEKQATQTLLQLQNETHAKEEALREKREKEKDAATSELRKDQAQKLLQVTQSRDTDQIDQEKWAKVMLDIAETQQKKDQELVTSSLQTVEENLLARSSAIAPTLGALLHFERARRLVQGGYWAAAAAESRSAVQQDANLGEGWLMLAKIDLVLLNGAESREAVEKAGLSRNPEILTQLPDLRQAALVLCDSKTLALVPRIQAALQGTPLDPFSANLANGLQIEIVNCLRDPSDYPFNLRSNFLWEPSKLDVISTLKLILQSKVTRTDKIFQSVDLPNEEHERQVQGERSATVTPRGQAAYAEGWIHRLLIHANPHLQVETSLTGTCDVVAHQCETVDLNFIGSDPVDLTPLKWWNIHFLNVAVQGGSTLTGTEGLLFETLDLTRSSCTQLQFLEQAAGIRLLRLGSTPLSDTDHIPFFKWNALDLNLATGPQRRTLLRLPLSTFIVNPSRMTHEEINDLRANTSVRYLGASLEDINGFHASPYMNPFSSPKRLADAGALQTAQQFWTKYGAGYYLGK